MERTPSPPQPLAILLLSLLAAVACAEERGARAPETPRAPNAADTSAAAGPPAEARAGEPGGAPEPKPVVAASLGDGFLVWESNRSGSWRLWIRDLADSEPRLLTPEEAGRRHCCAHISPDGEWIAYLSLPAGKQEYSDGVATGPLRLVRPDGSGERTLADEARTYFEHRAAVWRSPTELIHIGADGRTLLRDLSTGRARELTHEPVSEYGALVDSTLAWATSGRTDFSIYQPDPGRVVAQAEYSGCQPYFSHDGRWAFWTAGVGGPINRLDLESGQATPILRKNDPLLPAGMGYLYFPMLSRDGQLLAFGASRNEHDHFRSDYDVFVVETDPRTLEVLGAPVRMTDHPATDRFPDVFLSPLELGRHFGEAPLAVDFQAPGAGDWRWSFGDGSPEVVARERARHVFASAGRFEVRARAATSAGGRTRASPPSASGREQGAQTTLGPARGLVVASLATPPSALRAALIENGRRLEVPFDEPLGEEPPLARLEPPAAIERWSLSPDGRRLWLDLEAPLAGSARLHLSGLVDRAQTPNPMEPVELNVGPPLWPSNRDGLAFLWATGDAPNRLFDPLLGSERLSSVEASGGAVFDHNFAMRLGRGVFVASTEDQNLVLDAARAANRFSLETFVTPGATGQIVGMGSAQLNFALRAEGGALHFTIRTGGRGPRAYQGARVAGPEPERGMHAVFTYEPGRLSAFVNGESAGEWAVSGDFFHWRRHPLVFGQAVTAADGLVPSVEGVAIYDRPLGPGEVRENFLRYRALRAARAPVPRVEVEAVLVRRTAPPRLREISPYQEALVVWEWRVTEVFEGEHPGELVRVAHWAILDGKREALIELAEGASRRLTLERFEHHRQLEGVFLADSLGPGPALFHDVE